MYGKAYYHQVIAAMSQVSLSSQVNENDLSNYLKKVNFLNGLIEAQLMSTSSDRLMAAQILSPISINSSNELKSDKTKEIHLNIKSKAENEIRRELLDQNKTILKKRTAESQSSSADFDAVLKFHHSIQERVAEEMIELAHNLKHNCALSNDIIKKDTEVSISVSVTFVISLLPLPFRHSKELHFWPKETPKV